ncbi:MAG: hypothetical protein ACI8WB_003874 [Phenylobacterium sp.]|jgi:hypothetical protein
MMKVKPKTKQGPSNQRLLAGGRFSLLLLTIAMPWHLTAGVCTYDQVAHNEGGIKSQDSAITVPAVNSADDNLAAIKQAFSEQNPFFLTNRAQLSDGSSQTDADTPYIEYVMGDMPLILSAPHGGYKDFGLKLRSGSDSDGNVIDIDTYIGHKYAAQIRDTGSREFTIAVYDEIVKMTGKRPHLVLLNVDRGYIDINIDRDNPWHSATIGDTEYLDPRDDSVTDGLGKVDGPAKAADIGESYHQLLDYATRWIDQKCGPNGGLHVEMHTHASLHDQDEITESWRAMPEISYWYNPQTLTKEDMENDTPALNPADDPTYIKHLSVYNLWRKGSSGSPLKVKDILWGEKSLGSLINDNTIHYNAYSHHGKDGNGTDLPVERNIDNDGKYTKEVLEHSR